MKNSQRGSVSLVALVFASFLMSLGGAGAAAAYFQKNSTDFMAELRSYFATRVNAEELAPLDATQTPTTQPKADRPLDETITPTPTITPAPTLKPSVTVGGEENENESQEELHESNTAKLHEHEHRENLTVGVSAGIETEVGK